MGWVTDRATGATVNGGIWGGGTSLDRDAGFGFVLALEATFLDGRALVVESTVFADSIREAVIAARG